jgi:hypothetical protein
MALATRTRRTRRTRRRTKTLKTLKTYSKKDYNSGDGFLTTVWGPMMWSYLHTMSFNYPNNPTKEDKKHYKEFIENLQYVLPCKFCRMNLSNNLKEFPIKECHMATRDAFSRYVYDLHETVNKMLKKKSGLTFCEVRDRYENFRSRCTEDATIFNFKRDMKAQGNKYNGNKYDDNKKEKGCTEPLYGKKSKCVIKIIPQEDKQATFQMDAKCIKEKINVSY